MDHRTIGGYELVEEVRRQGVAVFCDAREQSSDRLVTLKVVSPPCASEQAQRLCKTEAEAVGRVDHPGVVQVLEVGKDKECHFVAYEHVPGNRTLDLYRNEVRQAERPPENHDSWSTGVIADVAKIMQAVHDVGVIHRNIKAANIFLTELGRPKVSGFELALTCKPRVGMRERLHAACGASRSSLSAKYLHSMRGVIVGTIAYMSPEQASGRMEIDHRTDIYSLGATLYELLALRAPSCSEKMTVVQIHQGVLTEEALDIRELRSDLSPDLARICMRAVRRDPSERYETMAGFGADLTSVQERL